MSAGKSARKRTVPDIFASSPQRQARSEAVAAVVAELKSAPHCIAVAACGVGKTFMQWGVHQEHKSPLTLVLVPTNELLIQTWDAWRQLEPQTHFLGITSAKQKDLQCTTDPAEAVPVLQSKGTVVVLSTYMSSPIAGEAAKRAGKTYELGIFDEAHRTVQPEDARYSVALTDEGVPINKRSFWTATPRFIRWDDEEERARLYSMDNPEVYGRVVYRLALHAAIERGIVCDYRILVPAIPLPRTNPEEVIREVKRLRTLSLETQIAVVERTLETHSIKKVITFHRTIIEAAEFAQAWNKRPGAAKQGIPGLLTHSGKTHRQRIDVLTQFAEEDSAIISNPSLLGEGVNVPSADLAANFCTQRSPIGVAQRIGRVLRKDPDNPRKRFGYILVPFFISPDLDETVSEAAERSGANPLWEVMQALLESQEGFEQILRGFQHGEPQEREESLKEMLEHIEVTDPWKTGLSKQSFEKLKRQLVVEFFSQITTSWDDHYRKLLEFQKAYGHTYVAASDARWDFSDPDTGVRTQGYTQWYDLFRWLNRQRKAWASGTLRADRQKLLTEAGVYPDPPEHRWHARFSQLEFWAKTIGCGAGPGRIGRELPYLLRGRLTRDEGFEIGKLGWCQDEKNWIGLSQFRDFCAWCAEQRVRPPTGPAQEALGRVGFEPDNEQANLKFYEAVMRFIQQRGISPCRGMWYLLDREGFYGWPKAVEVEWRLRERLPEDYAWRVASKSA